MKYITISSILILLPVLISCKNSTDVPASGNLIPLTIGNQWIYDLSSTDGNGDLMEPWVDTFAISQSFSIQGSSWLLFGMLNKGYFPPLTEYYENQNDGVWDFDTAIYQKELRFPYPSYAGYAYILSKAIDQINPYDSKTKKADTIITYSTGKIISTNESVVTPIGTFSCYHYQFKDSLSEPGVVSSGMAPYEFYVAPNLGIIKIFQQVGILTDSVGNVHPLPSHNIWLLKQYTFK